MFPESKVTEIYCMADDFCKEFALQQEKYMIEDKKTKHRNKPNRMSDAEIIVILILFHSGGFRCFKHYCWEPVPASVLLTPLLYVSVVIKESLFIRHLKDLPSVENVQWDGSSDSSCI